MTPRSTTRKRVLSGMRPTGKLHLGNFVGALQNWVGMQDQYECFFCVVDWHALTTDYADTSTREREFSRSRSSTGWPPVWIRKSPCCFSNPMCRRMLNSTCCSR